MVLKEWDVKAGEKFSLEGVRICSKSLNTQERREINGWTKT